MKILLVDNHTVYKKAIIDALSGHQVEVQQYQPGISFNTKGKDLVILSGGGGEGYEIDDEIIDGHLWYKDQMNFVKTCRLPILGICMGFEVICRAFGSEVEEMPEVIKGKLKLSATAKGRTLFKKSEIHQQESHKWRVKRAPNGFEVLATSSTGVEVIKHQDRPMLATQFHPELGGTLDLPFLAKLFEPSTT